MDPLHCPDSRTWISSKPIHLKTHFGRFSELVCRVQRRGKRVPKGDLRQAKDRALHALMGLDDPSIDQQAVEETFPELQQVCNVSLLT